MARFRSVSRVLAAKKPAHTTSRSYVASAFLTPFAGVLITGKGRRRLPLPPRGSVRLHGLVSRAGGAVCGCANRQHAVTVLWACGHTVHHYLKRVECSGDPALHRAIDFFVGPDGIQPTSRFTAGRQRDPDRHRTERSGTDLHDPSSMPDCDHHRPTCLLTGSCEFHRHGSATATATGLDLHDHHHSAHHDTVLHDHHHSAHHDTVLHDHHDTAHHDEHEPNLRPAHSDIQVRGDAVSWGRWS